MFERKKDGQAGLFWAACGAVLIGLLLAQACARNPRPQQPSQRIRTVRSSSFTVTAYCLKGKTAAGTHAADGVVAADLRVFPLGTVIRVDGLSGYNGMYTVLDSGRSIRGRRIDLYVSSCTEAVRFGRRAARVSVAR
jgi:3D (Asp-Asp-Asp) domain-containing protein